MRKFHVIALATVLPLAACSRNDPPPAPAPGGASAAQPATDTVVSRKLQEAMAKSSEKLATANIPVGGRIHHGIRIDSSGSPLPKAEITPQGDLLINGKAVTIDAQQRALLLDYRKQVEKLAGAGMDIGVAGASLGVKAAGEALRGVFSGDTQGIEERVNAEAAKIEASAKQLCELLPTMMAKQQALAAALPAFKPYATMDQSDVDDCHN